MPLGRADAALYRSVREAVPIVDAAIGKLVRAQRRLPRACEDERAQEGWAILRTVNGTRAGGLQRLSGQVSGFAADERARGGRDRAGRGGTRIAAVLCHRWSSCLREGETALDVRFCGYDAAGRLHELPRQELVLFTPLLPESENPYGVSLLRSMPFMAELLAHLLRGGAELGALRQRALRGGLQAAGRGAGQRAGARAGRAAGAGVVRRDAGDARRERA